jgi:hypothetical protein
MSIEYSEQTAAFSDVVGVDDAERLLEWLQTNPAARVDLSACTHLHPANLQVLMAARPTIGAWPRDADLAGWLRPALGTLATP